MGYEPRQCQLFSCNHLFDPRLGKAWLNTALLDCCPSVFFPFTAYFALQVIHARWQYRISPPRTTGHPEFELVFRAQVNCSEYFPIFTWLLWVAGLFFHQAVAAACGLLCLYTHLRYFQGYAAAAQGRLDSLYASARVLGLLLGLAVPRLLAHFLLPCCSPWMAVLVRPLQHLGAW
ncbi:leukotriene C4 synthase [Pezoporus occidentalis]|uniref:leukotriene C4 synthase n=1 Tax=Pezoporus occidentalis TaxID=407982 RepID=UPI002F9167AF